MKWSHAQARLEEPDVLRRDACPSPRVGLERSPRAERVEIRREPPDHLEDDLLDPLAFCCEDLEDRPRVDRLGALVDAGVVVGDERDVHDRHPELAAEVRLGILGHRDDLPAGVAEPLRLGLRREARAVDDHDRARSWSGMPCSRMTSAAIRRSSGS
jgi:hypothetical protein